MADAPTSGDTLSPAAQTLFGGDASPQNQTPGNPPVSPQPDPAAAASDGPAGDQPNDKPSDATNPDEKPDGTQYELKFPDGFEVDQTAVSEFTTLAEEAGVKPEVAQKLVDLYAKQVTALQEAQTNNWNKMIGDWQQALDSDKDIGGDNKAAAEGVLAAALDQYGSQEARQAFDLTGAGWNPHIVKFVYNMAKALTEGTPVAPASPANAGAPKTPGQRLYGEPAQ